MDVEKAMAVELAGRLQRGLTGRDTERMIRRYADSPEAYQAYLQGQHYLKQRTAEGYARSITYFEHAIARDPTYALAYAGLAETYTIAGYFYTLPASQAYPRARTAALRALELDDQFAEAHAALAAVQLYYEWNFPSAEQRFKAALALEPTFATAIMGYSILLASAGTPRRSDQRGHAGRAARPGVARHRAQPRMALFYDGQYDRAMEQVQKTLELSPNFVTSCYLLAQVVIATGLTTDEMREIVDRYKVDPAIARPDRLRRRRARRRARQTELPRVAEAAGGTLAGAASAGIRGGLDSSPAAGLSGRCARMARAGPTRCGRAT